LSGPVGGDVQIGARMGVRIKAAQLRVLLALLVLLGTTLLAPMLSTPCNTKLLLLQLLLGG
jgi:methylglyoxal synthase